jgi:hypothetical protein
MHLTAPLPLLRRRDGAAQRRRSAEARPPRQGVTGAQARARRGGASQDRALYRCECGYAFEAEVTTSVGCPHCGTHQAW